MIHQLRTCFLKYIFICLIPICLFVTLSSWQACSCLYALLSQNFLFAISHIIALDLWNHLIIAEYVLRNNWVFQFSRKIDASFPKKAILKILGVICSRISLGSLRFCWNDSYAKIKGLVGVFSFRILLIRRSLKWDGHLFNRRNYLWYGVLSCIRKG